jgi:acetyltransferase-like isoleucine patch superfamily enzyme
MNLSGNVVLTADLVRAGMIKIGFGEVGIFDQHKSRTVWQVSGTVEFKGEARIGHGSKISVMGTLVLGNNLVVTAESSIVAHERIVVGNDVFVSWDVLIMDTDIHEIHGADGRHINSNAPVTIGNKVWIGCRSLILKGVQIADGVVVAAASTVTKPSLLPNAVIGGSPARVLRENVTWNP